MFRKKKIPCYVLIFDQVDYIKKCLNFITKNADQLEIIVVENPSANTPVIKKYVESLGKKGLIKRYYLFDKNITSNAVTTVFNIEKDIIRKSKYTIITDGDLTSKNKDWLDEELSIMRHKDVFACGMSLDMSNLPVKTYPEAENWRPHDIAEHEDYIESHTGGYLLMMRGNEFAEYLDWKDKNKVNHIDSEMYKYCYNQINKKWARTKRSEAYHLTWDLYADKNHPYTKFRAKKSFKETWDHQKKAKYSLVSY